MIKGCRESIVFSSKTTETKRHFAARRTEHKKQCLTTSQECMICSLFTGIRRSCAGVIQECCRKREFSRFMSRRRFVAATAAAAAPLCVLRLLLSVLALQFHIIIFSDNISSEIQCWVKMKALSILIFENGKIYFRQARIWYVSKRDFLTVADSLTIRSHVTCMRYTGSISCRSFHFCALLDHKYAVISLFELVLNYLKTFVSIFPISNISKNQN
jgi:hypothetical protein